MKFYCIIENDNEESQKRYSLLEKSCIERCIQFVKITPSTFNYLEDSIEKESILYRATPGDKGRIIEKWLAPKTTTLYINSKDAISDKSSLIFYNRLSVLPIIKTIPDFISNPNALDQYINFVDGFPLIVKITGKSHGAGVIKIDSKESLQSFQDLLKGNNEKALLRKFIKHKKQGRLIVLGDTCIASHVNYCGIDFRSNVGTNQERKRDPMIFPEEVNNIAIKAVQSIGLEFGGVDILFDEETEAPYIAEVNSPCFFPTTQILTGVDIAGKMIDFLINKSKNRYPDH